MKMRLALAVLTMTACVTDLNAAEGLDLFAGTKVEDLDFIPDRIFARKEAYFNDQEKVGERTFYRSGKVAEEFVYSSGKLNGTSHKFYENGAIFGEYPYVDGLLHGEVRFFSAKGEPIGVSKIDKGTGVLHQLPFGLLGIADEILPMKDGKLDGVKVVSAKFSHGVGRELAEYRMGEMSGWDVVVDSKGLVVASSYFHAGKLHGASRKFDAAGKIKEGYPTFFVQNKKVDEPTYRAAAENDEILKKTLLDDGREWTQATLKANGG